MKEFVNQLIPVLVLSSQVAMVMVGLVWLFWATKRKIILNTLGKRAMGLGLAVALTATLGSLFYSEVMGFEPCVLCWYQRILMYPQILMLTIALVQRRRYSVESTILAGIGAVIALYHYLLQRSAVPSYFCEAVGYSQSCTDTFEMTYGYLTIPLMALTAFGLILGFNFLGWGSKKRQFDKR